MEVAGSCTLMSTAKDTCKITGFRLGLKTMGLCNSHLSLATLFIGLLVRCYQLHKV